MRRGGTYGGEIEMQILARLYHVKIVVHYTTEAAGSKWIFDPPEGTQAKSVWHILFDGEGKHFEPLLVSHGVTHEVEGMHLSYLMCAPQASHAI